MSEVTCAKLMKQYDANSVRAGFLRCWFRRNPAAKAHLSSRSTTSRFLDEADQVSAAAVESLILRKVGYIIGLKDIEAVFEAQIDAHRKKKQGAVYTPDYIIDYLITEGLRSFPQSGSIAPRILDPACGSAGFLLRAARYLGSAFDLTPELAFAEHIAGIDNDGAAIEHARCLVELFLASQGTMLKPEQLRLCCQDTLLDSPKVISANIGFDEGVDLLATNPPYVKLQNLDDNYRRMLSTRYSGFTNFNFSLALIFLIAGHRLLGSNGLLAFITQNNLFTSFAGEQFRRYFQEQRCLWRIVDFGHCRVFANVLAYTCLLFLDKKNHSHIEFARIERDLSLASLRTLNLTKVPISTLEARKWRLAEVGHQKNIEQIETTGTPLGQVVDIRVGFATLKDKVFLVLGTKDQCVAAHEADKIEIELAVTVPAVKIAAIGNERELTTNALRIIFPYVKTNGKYVLLPEEELRSRFPKAYAYLSLCRPLLEARDKGKRSYEAWYAWGRTQGREAPGPKLLTKTFNSKPQFFFDPTDQLFCNGYGAFPKGQSLFDSGLSLRVLQCILQSRVMHYYAKMTSFQIEGDYQCYQKNFIERFGIPDLSTKSGERILSLVGEEREDFIARLYQLRLEELLSVVTKETLQHSSNRAGSSRVPLPIDSY